jgi:hypothetical protein
MLDELRAAQRLDPVLFQIIQVLQSKPAGSFIADPRRNKELIKARARAQHFKLGEGQVLLGKCEDSLGVPLPVVPDTSYVPPTAPKPPKEMTWKHLLLASVHNTRMGAHLQAKEMVEELSGLVHWFPPERLRVDCETWCRRCKHCVATLHRPAGSPPSHAVLSFRPGYRMQLDWMEVKPTGENGEDHILTVLCVSTRYPWFRTASGRDQVKAAALLLDVVLDAGVMPSIFHSDNEFISLVLEEFATLMGSQQLYSTALRPQSLGADERIHRDIRAGLSILVDAFSRAVPRSWPRLVRYIESKCRHKKGSHGISPYQCWHGFSGSSPLASSLQAFQEIPASLVHTEWLQGIVLEAARLGAELDAKWEEQAASSARLASESQRSLKFVVGELVFVHKPFWERGAGLILPQADGPFRVERIFDAHTCSLSHALSGLAYMHGQRISLARLIKFDFPSQYIQSDITPDQALVPVMSLTPGEFVALELNLVGVPRIYIGRVIRTFPANAQLEVEIWHVSSSQRFGPWTRRPWSPMLNQDHSVRREVVTEAELLCRAVLVDHALDQSTLEALAHLGVPVEHVPHRDSVMPPRLR